MLRKKYQNEKNGFSSKELLFALIGVGLLCLAAIPVFHYLQENFTK